VDQRGAPLSAWITGANQHDKWSLDDLVIHILLKRPTSDQHLCADKGYDYPDVHQFVTEQGYQKHIKHRRRRGEPKPDPCPIPGETQFPARRWVVERTPQLAGETAQHSDMLVQKVAKLLILRSLCLR
jgi:putative transposase